jgi:hypothetical protein
VWLINDEISKNNQEIESQYYQEVYNLLHSQKTEQLNDAKVQKACTYIIEHTSVTKATPS